MKYLELVPRDIDEVTQFATRALSEFPFLTGINIPDVLRIPHRSYVVAEHFLKHNIQVIPHIRCIDHPLSMTIDMIARLVDLGLNDVLIISGDPPKDPLAPQYDINAIQLTTALRNQFDTLHIYCAIDQYRSTLEKEVKYAHQKLDAGATGFFTQPFFDCTFAHQLLDSFDTTPIFLGISPVLSETSKQYWISQNKVRFSDSFETTLSYHATLARDLIALSKNANQHCYLMPIKTPLFEYLHACFD